MAGLIKQDMCKLADGTPAFHPSQLWDDSIPFTFPLPPFMCLVGCFPRRYNSLSYVSIFGVHAMCYLKIHLLLFANLRQIICPGVQNYFSDAFGWIILSVCGAMLQINHLVNLVNLWTHSEVSDHMDFDWLQILSFLSHSLYWKCIVLNSFTVVVQSYVSLLQNQGFKMLESSRCFHCWELLTSRMLSISAMTWGKTEDDANLNGNTVKTVQVVQDPWLVMRNHVMSM